MTPRRIILSVEVVYGTSNQGKLNDVKKILSDCDVSVLSLPDIGVEVPIIDESGKTFEENAIIKYKALRPLVPNNYILAVEDSGLEVDALDGAPGVYSRRWKAGGKEMTDTESLHKILDEMKGKKDRTAKFVSVIAFGGSGQAMQTIRGELAGVLLEEPDLEGFMEGMPYRALFYIPQLHKMLYQIHGMPLDKRKRLLTHREKVWLNLIENISSRRTSSEEIE